MKFVQRSTVLSSRAACPVSSFAESEAVSFDTERRRCPKCCVLFSTRGTMLRHLALHAPKYQCDICFKLFSRKQYTLLHRKIKHGIDFGPY